MEVLKKLLNAEGITEFATVDFERLTVINPRLLNGKPGIKSAAVFLIPYRHAGMKEGGGFNVGLFARCRDYHLYAKGLFERIIPALMAETGGEIYGYADSSPIDEKGAAATAGLGFIGKNGLLINPVYGSFVFIAELLFTKRLEEDIRHCDGGCGNCTACIDACPAGALKGGYTRERCLSFISQKKRKTKEDCEVLKANKTVWGCDICQRCCPYNKGAQFSNIAYFKEGFIEDFTPQRL